jgi:sec-independent protein translocase protein TatC
MSEESVPDQGQTILEHLGEFRVRLTWAAAGLVVATIISFLFVQELLTILIKPYGERLQTLSPTEGIETYFRVALVAGVALSMPWILYQFWRFVSPGLHSHERRYVFVFVPAASLLFLVGVAFAWLVLLPSAIAFLSTFMPTIFVAEWTSQEYIGFATTFLLWIGIAFQMPLIVYFLARFGIINSKTLVEHWRIALVAIAVIAAAVTPSIDPVTMLLTMVPLIILYLLSIVLARVGYRQFLGSGTVDGNDE